MKKIVLLMALALSSISLNAASLLGQVSVKDSMCYYWGNSWTHPTLPNANTCFDIRNVYTNLNRWDNGSHGNVTKTSKNLEGDYMLIQVDVFGVPANEPTVMYKYQTLNAVGYEQIVNYDSNPAIINGSRYWFQYRGNVGSGDIIVKHYANYVDELEVR
ncbi:hypothetical protein [Poseidonibacter lekithochrous]|uniref:hypothetical protein n=1 Tax=Poseidonibacter lekithochrous TaxID=1904463 RepID=UPI0008FCD4FD|nr:hypothetical protein [Poseidonibacter lekithochrous]QKJ24042.1 hypothetical protein ALEK_2819 [Poseidonibacter lekithochrous]